MPTWLREPRWSKVDLVDRPADPHAKFAIFKRDEGHDPSVEGEEEVIKSSPTAGGVHSDRPLGSDEDEKKKKKKEKPVYKADTPITSEEYDRLSDEQKRLYRLDRESGKYVPVQKREFSVEKRRELAKKGMALPDGSFPIENVEDLRNAVQAFGRAKDKEAAKRHIVKRAKALGATKELPDSWNVSKKEEGTMPEKLTEEVRKSLPQEVQDYLASLEAAAEEGATEPSPGGGTEEELSKRDDIPEDVRELINKRDEELAAISKRAEEAEKVAKAERDARVLREWQDRVTKVADVVEDVDSTATELKELADTNPELADKLMKRFEALQEQAATSALFEEIGKTERFANSAEGQLEQVVKSIQESEKVSEEKAWDIALDRNPELYARYREEVSR